MLRRFNTRTRYWKIPVILLFSGLAYWEIQLHSEHWNSLADGFLYVSSNMDDAGRIALIREGCLYTVSISSILLLIVDNRIIMGFLLVFMIVNLVLIAPWNYISDPSIGF